MFAELLCLYLNSHKDLIVSGKHTKINEYDKIAQILRIDIIIIIGYNYKYINGLLTKINNYNEPKKILIILPESIFLKHKNFGVSANIQFLTFEQKIENIEEKISSLTKVPCKLEKKNSFDIISNITIREKEILQLIRMGKKNKEIAEELFLSIKTVENHRNNILRKTHSKSMLTLINKLYKLGIFEL